MVPIPGSFSTDTPAYSTFGISQLEIRDIRDVEIEPARVLLSPMRGGFVVGPARNDEPILPPG